jgi:hypothetical protein
MCPNETPGAEGARKVQKREEKGNLEKGRAGKVEDRKFRER